MEEIVFEYSYGQESYGRVIKKSETEYECQDIPLYGGDWQTQKTFDNLDEAIDYIKNLT